MAALRKVPSEISEDDALAEGKHYYTSRHNTWKTRTQSVSGGQLAGKANFNGEAIRRNRRLSHGKAHSLPCLLFCSTLSFSSMSRLCACFSLYSIGTADHYAAEQTNSLSDLANF